MTQGTCTLCLRPKTLLRSHFVPASILKSLVEPSLADSEPVLVSSRIVINTTKPIAKDLLCGECEELFNKNGESWVSQMIARHGSFPLAREVESCPMVMQDKNLNVHRCKGKTAIDIEKLTYFALSMFWRSAAVGWLSITRVPRISLEPYEESVRRFLRGDEPFPSGLVLLVTLWTHEPSNLQVILPAESPQNAPYRVFGMQIPGIEFVLFTGNDIPLDARAQCVYSSEDKAVAVANVINTVSIGKMQANFNAAHHAPKIAAKYRDYLRADEKESAFGALIYDLPEWVGYHVGKPSREGELPSARNVLGTDEHQVSGIGR